LLCQSQALIAKLGWCEEVMTTYHCEL
jgi:hypothetical protein